MKSKNKMGISRVRKNVNENSNSEEDAVAGQDQQSVLEAECNKSSLLNDIDAADSEKTYKVKAVENYSPMQEGLPPNVEVMPTSRIKTLLITFATGLVITFGILMFQGIFNKSTAKEVFDVLADGFFVSGVVFAGIGALQFSANHGSFDMLAYAGRNMLGFIIPPIALGKQMKYADYVEKRKQKVRKFSHLLITGAVLIGLSIIFLIIYYAL